MLEAGFDADIKANRDIGIESGLEVDINAGTSATVEGLTTLSLNAPIVGLNGTCSGVAGNFDGVLVTPLTGIGVIVEGSTEVFVC